MLKLTCMLGLVTITAAIGLVSAPVRAQNAASVEQSSNQNTTQVGSGNSSVNASDQTAIGSQTQPTFGSGINAAAIRQVNNQAALQAGFGNSSVNASNQTAIGSQLHSYLYFPSSGGINASDLTQSSAQAAGQFGTGNSAINASNQSTAVHQH